MDPMKYTMDELVRALVLQTMGEVALDESELVADNEYDVFANNLYHQLRGVRPGSKIAEEIISKMAYELDRYAHAPAAHNLLSCLEELIWSRYKEDPSPYIQIVVSALSSPAANDWYNNHRKRR